MSGVASATISVLSRGHGAKNSRQTKPQLVQVWSHLDVISVPGRLRQKDLHDFKASLGYITETS